MTHAVANDSSAGGRLPNGMATLRHVTDVLHSDIETQLQLPQSLGSAADVVVFLQRWLALARTLEPLAAQEPIAGVQPVIEADLRALGVEAITSRDEALAPDPVGLDEVMTGRALGTAWVLQGARLGLRTLGPRLRELTGHDVELCTSVDAAALIDLRHKIDRRADDGLEPVIEGASAAFATARDILRGPPWT